MVQQAREGVQDRQGTHTLLLVLVVVLVLVVLLASSTSIKGVAGVGLSPPVGTAVAHPREP